MARSKTWAIGQSALLENTIANNNEWKENLRLSQQYPSLFGRILFLVVEATNSLLTNVPGVITMCKRSGIRIFLQCERQRIRKV